MVKKNKLKPLSPSLREKKRYLVFKVISKREIDANSLSNSIKQGYKELFGEFGLAEANIKLIRDMYTKQKGIIRLNNKYENNLKATLATIKNINGIKVVLASMYLSGILKKAESYLRGG